MKNVAELGSVSHGTMRAEDLIPCFVDALTCLVSKEDVDIVSLLEKVAERMDTMEDYFESEDADWDLEELFDALNEYAPEGAYFGSHPGDGSDYGFWANEDAE